MAAAVAGATPRAPAEMVALEPHLEVVVVEAVDEVRFVTYMAETLGLEGLVAWD